VSPIDIAMLRDRILDWMAESAPMLLQDDVLAEGVLFIVCREVSRAVRNERERQQQRLRRVEPC
jgi:hypothetical protein